MRKSACADRQRQAAGCKLITGAQALLTPTTRPRHIRNDYKIQPTTKRSTADSILQLRNTECSADAESRQQVLTLEDVFLAAVLVSHTIEGVVMWLRVGGHPQGLATSGAHCNLATCVNVKLSHLYRPACYRCGSGANTGALAMASIVPLAGCMKRKQC